MTSSQKNLFLKVGNLIIAALTPGHILRNVVHGICLGISILGFISISILWMAPMLNASLSYGTGNIILWSLANLYLIITQLVSKDFSKRIVTKTPMNTGSDSEESICRAA